MIVPKQNRLFVYAVLDESIINEKWLKPKHIKTDLTKIFASRTKCLDLMNNHNNLNTFIYIHNDGRIEEEINVARPKYKFHSNYTSDHLL
jgi:hypothetical protein